ncbi:uncharacterized protein [Rutidosis leptorrhynchoides]|uniref:uncharacterized protein n=1 Tax=Rutidosis leptorrhynchoides TaxID=125765 RepID=UPI003A99DA26
MKKIGLGYEAIHACKNDCCLFYKEYQDLENCPICKESRCKAERTTGKKVPNKVLRYFPITPRLKHLYSSRYTAKDMTWHTTGRCTEEGKMRHQVDGRAWKEIDKRYPDFAREPRNVRLGLAADGFNPHGNLSTAYSMWPVILTVYNTTSWICMKESSFMLTLLIPGPKSPGKDIDVYLRPLVDELKSLWFVGVITRNSVTNTYFQMKAMLIWTINDYPARSSLSGWSGQGYKACPTCNEDTPSMRVQNKISYFGARQNLEMDHPYRENTQFNGKVDHTPKPRKFNWKMIESQLKDILPVGNPGKNHKNTGEKKNIPLIISLLTTGLNQFEAENTGVDMKTHFSCWLTKKVRELRLVDPSKVSDELFSLAEGPLGTSNHYSACNVNGVRFVVCSRDDRRTTQNSGIATPAENKTMYYGLLEDIVELHYGGAYSVVLFRCQWFKTESTRKQKRKIKVNNITSIDTKDEWYKDDQYILLTQAQQVFYIDDPSKNYTWKVVHEVNHRKLWDRDIIEDTTQRDVVHDINSSELSLDANLDNMTYTSMSVPGESTSIHFNLPTEVVNDDDDFIRDLDPIILPHDISDDPDDVVADDELDPQIPENGAYSSDEAAY